MIAFKHSLKSFLTNPFIIFDLLDLEIRSFLFRSGIYGWCNGIRLKIIYANLAYRLIRRGYDNDEAQSIMLRWISQRSLKLNKNLRVQTILLTEAIADVSRKTNIPEYEIRHYLEEQFKTRGEDDIDI